MSMKQKKMTDDERKLRDIRSLAKYTKRMRTDPEFAEKSMEIEVWRKKKGKKCKSKRK